MDPRRAVTLAARPAPHRPHFFGVQLENGGGADDTGEGMTKTRCGLAILLAACSAGSGEPLGEPIPALGEPYASVLGVVWAPGQAPGDAPRGREIPVSRALVRLLPRAPAPPPDGVSCRACLPTSGEYAALTDEVGAFEIADVAPGRYWVVVEAGPFRIDTRIEVRPGQLTVLEPDATTLPSTRDPERGRWAPRVATLPGHDGTAWLEAQLQLGEVEPLDEARLASPGSLARFDVLVAPSTEPDALTRDPAALAALRDWVARGGVLVATGRAHRLVDALYPSAVVMTSTHDIESDVYDPDRGTWDVSRIPAAPDRREDWLQDVVAAPRARASHAPLAAWLREQVGPAHRLASDGPDMMGVHPGVGPVWRYDPRDLAIERPLGRVVALGATPSSDPTRDPSYPRVLLEEVAGHPAAVAIAPEGCGRALLSMPELDLVAHDELLPMERVALYFLLDTPVCVAPPD